MSATGVDPRLVLLFCFFSSAVSDAFAFTEEPSDRAVKADGYCSRILRDHSSRKETNTEFRLRVEGDPESYQPGSTYRGPCGLNNTWLCLESAENFREVPASFIRNASGCREALFRQLQISYFKQPLV